MENSDAFKRAKWFPWMLFAAFALVFVAIRAMAIRTESINWDEFALMQRTANMLRTGQIQGGGRPGLVEVTLAPFVAGCQNSIIAVRAARVLWSGFTLGALAGLYVLLLQLRRRTSQPWLGASLGVGLLVLVPVFLRWSIQVRTDQLALLLGLWGGVALLASRRRAWFAFVSGVLLALGLLYTQKLIYIAGLVGVIGLIDTLQEPEGWRAPGFLSAGIRRVCLVVLGVIAVGAVYKGLLPQFVRLPSGLATLESGLSTFAYYRSFFGFTVYRGMLPSLVVHMILLALLLPATVLEVMRRSPIAGLLLPAWTALALGTGVMFFHAAAFPYFWMILGVFPAVAVGLAIESILELFPRVFLGSVILVAVGIALVAQSVPAVRSILTDTQIVQRESLSFVERNYSEDDRGFQAEGALFCRNDPQPLPVMFSESILKRFFGAQADDNIRSFINEFRSRPVKFVISSHVMFQFPDEIKRFWASHYTPYYSQVWVPGQRLSGTGGQERLFEIVVPGKYRWLPQRADGTIVIDGRTVVSEQIVELQTGIHRTIFTNLTSGILHLAVKDSYRPVKDSFYGRESLLDFTRGGKLERWESVVKNFQRNR